MKEINLNRLKLKTFIKQDVLDYCLLNNINPNNITELYLSDNQLTDITGIKLFKNLKELYIHSNLIKDISVLKDLINLKILDILDLELESDQIKYINLCKNLKELRCENGFKDMSIINKLNKNMEIIK